MGSTCALHSKGWTVTLRGQNSNVCKVTPTRRDCISLTLHAILSNCTSSWHVMQAWRPLSSDAAAMLPWVEGSHSALLLAPICRKFGPVAHALGRHNVWLHVNFHTHSCAKCTHRSCCAINLSQVARATPGSPLTGKYCKHAWCPHRACHCASEWM